MSSHGLARKLARIRKMNRMLLLVSLVFFMSWAPIHVFNLMLDISDLVQVSIYSHVIV